MDDSGELSRRELLGLKEIALRGRMTDRALATQLIDDHLTIGSPAGYLKLTAKGRRLLVRGSASLWELVS
jgi:hypothetical protein